MFLGAAIATAAQTASGSNFEAKWTQLSRTEVCVCASYVSANVRCSAACAVDNS